MEPLLGTLSELAARIGGEVRGDGTIAIMRIAAVSEAGPGALTFATEARALRLAYECRASAILVDARLVAGEADPAKSFLIVPSARVALAQLLTAFERPRRKGPFRHPTAVVDPTAIIGADVYLGPLVIVGAEARIGERSVLEAGAIIGDRARLGSDAHLHPRATLLDDCVAGDRVILQVGAVVGSDGFGYVPVEGRLLKIPQIGIVELGDDVEIGANTCIDRAQTGVTKIGPGTKLDNLVQIGHNVKIGEMTVIAAQAGLAGSATVGAGVQIGGKAAVNGHISIGSGTRIAGASRVWSSQPPGSTVSGDPAQDHRQELRRKVLFKSLPKLVARLEALERREAKA